MTPAAEPDGPVELDDLAHLTPDLASLGWDEELDRWAAGEPGRRAAADPDDAAVDAEIVPGRLARVSRGFSLVFTGGDALLAASGSTRAADVGEPATGDFVLVRVDGDDGPVLSAIAPRRTSLCRRAPGRYPEPQVLAANADAVLVMHGLDRDLNLRRIERQLVVAWDSGARPVVVLTKTDVADRVGPVVERVAAVAPGVEVIPVSAADGEGLDRVHALVENHHAVVMLGLSGIGKSTLVNALSDGLVQRTGEVRAADRRGRHTTVTRDLIPLPSGGFVMDTPGIREIGLWQARDGLDRTFPEIAEAAGGCRFGDCTHDGEPGCEVMAATVVGLILPRRLDHWRELNAEIDLQDTQLTEFARRAESRQRVDAEEQRDRTRSARRRNRPGSRRRRRR
ncbi:MAG: ribosome small subunit-dependent GTPase A [Acidimicrobiales bacterium]